MMSSSHNRNLASNDPFQILSKEVRWSSLLWRISLPWSDGMNSRMKDWDIRGCNQWYLQANHELFMRYDLKCSGSLRFLLRWHSRWSCKYQKSFLLIIQFLLWVRCRNGEKRNKALVQVDIIETEEFTSGGVAFPATVSDSTINISTSYRNVDGPQRFTQPTMQFYSYLYCVSFYVNGGNIGPDVQSWLKKCNVFLAGSNFGRLKLSLPEPESGLKRHPYSSNQSMRLSQRFALIWPSRKWSHEQESSCIPGLPLVQPPRGRLGTSVRKNSTKEAPRL